MDTRGGILLFAQGKQQTCTETVGHRRRHQTRRIGPRTLAQGRRLIGDDIAEITKIDFEDVVLDQIEFH